MSDINPSALGESFDQEFETKVAACSTAAEISELMKNRSVAIGLTRRDIYSPDVLIPVAGPVPQKVAKVISLNGVKHIIEADTEQALLATENEFCRQQFQPETETRTEQPQPRNEHGQFVSAEDAAANAELELAFKRGDISASEYIQQSGAVAEYLEKAGVPLEDLQASVAEKQVQRFEQSWADATEAFKARHPEWSGGESNRDTVGKIIAENNLVDAEDKVAALELAYNHARENNLLVENPDTAYQRELSECKSAEDVTRLNHKFFGSGLFNR